MTANESEIGGTPGCNYSDVETETHTHTDVLTHFEAFVQIMVQTVPMWLVIPNHSVPHVKKKELRK